VLRGRDYAFFAAVSNIHYPVLELLRVEFSYGLLPIQFLLLAGMAVITDRATVLMRGGAYAIVAAMYFGALSVFGVGFVPMGAFVTITQTATAIVFIDYLLALGPDAARSAVRNIQRMLGMYVVAFALLVIAIRVANDRTLFNQVAQSNYMGMLTTYLILNLLRRGQIPARAGGLTLSAVLVNVLGQQRSSFLLNAVVIGRRALASNRAIILVAVIGTATLTYLVAGDFIRIAAEPLLASILAYVALIPLGFQNLESVIRYAVIAPESGLDASLMLRAISMVYIGHQIIQDPFRPVASGENEYLGVSHNIPFEYFKVGGLLFFVLSLVIVLIRYRRLIARGYFRIDPFGLVVALIYSQLFNDLVLGFVLLPLALHSARRGVQATSPTIRTAPIIAASPSRLTEPS
jgi:hypothetical protein